MKARQMISKRWPVIGLILLIALFALSALADDGPMVRKPISRTPNDTIESEKAQLSMFQFFVPATKSNGERTTISYYADRDGDNKEDELIETREYAKPLLVTYYDDVPLDTKKTKSLFGGIATNSGSEVGIKIHRDAWASYSFDDGETWKQVNLSESVNESSFDVDTRDPATGEVTGSKLPYPGDVPTVMHAIAGNKILVAWASKYCAQGSPMYSIKDVLDHDGDGDVEEPLYEDLFDVAGNQGSIDYYEYMHHGQYPFREVGEIPFSCIWTMRGTIEEVMNTSTGTLQWGIKWRKPERLTSGKRDANYLAMDGVEGAGFVLAWQEDPEGLRPGSGEGPGVGWSGATVNHKTDMWYSFIGWNDFDAVDTSTQDPTTNRPKVANFMSMPIRLSDNYNCLSDRVDQDGNPHPGYCFADWNLNGTPDLCASTYQWTNSQGKTMNVCVTEDGRLMNGQIGASRARLALEGYTKPDGTKSAWVVIAYEETKGLGSGHTDLEPLDIGKDVMYHSFDIFNPELAAPGTMLNMPSTDPLSDPENPALLPMILNDKGEYQYQTSIGRRPSLIVQPSYMIKPGRTSAFMLYKDGEERQGGPADIFMRRFIVPASFDPSRDNPYDIRNLTCNQYDNAIVDSSPSSYPRSAYPDGLCVFGSINISGTTETVLEPLDNAADGELPSHGITERVLQFEQTPANLDDESWVNKYDVSKGHRGFIDGDFVMVMYGYSPNWLATSHGKEATNLYVRRSFDGGETWTTTPSRLGGDGTSYEQTFGVGDRAYTITRTLAAGEFEPARNVSLLTASTDTILDPRYSPTNIGTQKSVTRLLLDGATQSYQTFMEYEDDYVRDPSIFSAVYETGDGSTVLTHGEADPEDLFYSRATNYGDDWDFVDVFASGKGEYEERWDWLENKDSFSGEATMAMSPGGDFVWVVWNQWDEAEDGTISASDPIYRRLWWDPNMTTLVADAGSYTAAEGAIVTLTGSASYPSSARTSRFSVTSHASTNLTWSWDLDMDGVFETEGQTALIVASGSMQGIAVRVCDSKGCDVDQGWINENHHSPRVWKVTVTQSQAGTAATLSARFTDPGVAASATAFIDWGDGSMTPGIPVEDYDGKGSAMVTGTHKYLTAGLYNVKVSVTDDDGNTGWDFGPAVVFDRANGNLDISDAQFIDPNSGGTADFTFTAKYDKGAIAPRGKMKFKLGKTIDAYSSTHDWYIAMSGGRFYAQGSNATVNGKSGYSYVVTALDGKTDFVRVRIFKGRGLNRELVYDSQPGTDDFAVPTTSLTKGAIKISF